MINAVNETRQSYLAGLDGNCTCRVGRVQSIFISGQLKLFHYSAILLFRIPHFTASPNPLCTVVYHSNNIKVQRSEDGRTTMMSCWWRPWDQRYSKMYTVDTCCHVTCTINMLLPQSAWKHLTLDGYPLCCQLGHLVFRWVSPSLCLLGELGVLYPVYLWQPMWWQARWMWGWARIGAHTHVTQHVYKDTTRCMSLWIVVCCCPGLLKK